MPVKLLPSGWLVGASIRQEFDRATRDWLVPKSAGGLITTIRPATKVVEIDAPHFLLQTAPAQAAREVAAFARLNARR